MHQVLANVTTTHCCSKENRQDTGISHKVLEHASGNSCVASLWTSAHKQVKPKPDQVLLGTWSTYLPEAIGETPQEISNLLSNLHNHPRS